MQNFIKRENIQAGVYLIAMLITAVGMYFIMPRHGEVRYDCSIAEISPDYPIEVKEKCRKLRAENSKESLQKPK